MSLPRPLKQQPQDLGGKERVISLCRSAVLSDSHCFPLVRKHRKAPLTLREVYVNLFSWQSSGVPSQDRLISVWNAVLPMMCLPEESKEPRLMETNTCIKSTRSLLYFKIRKTIIKYDHKESSQLLTQMSSANARSTAPLELHRSLFCLLIITRGFRTLNH